MARFEEAEHVDSVLSFGDAALSHLHMLKWKIVKQKENETQ